MAVINSQKSLATGPLCFGIAIHYQQTLRSRGRRGEKSHECFVSPNVLEYQDYTYEPISERACTYLIYIFVWQKHKSSFLTENMCLKTSNHISFTTNLFILGHNTDITDQCNCYLKICHCSNQLTPGFDHIDYNLNSTENRIKNQAFTYKCISLSWHLSCL